MTREPDELDLAKAITDEWAAAIRLLSRENNELRAEVERLRKLPPYPVTTLSKENEELRAEVERLRVENKWLYAQMAAQKATLAAEDPNP